MRWWRQDPPVARELSATGEPMGTSWPRGYDTGDEARRSKFVGRWFAVAFGISMAVNLVQVGAMMAQRNACNARIPFFLQTAPSVDALVQVRPFSEKGEPLKIATQIWVKEFVDRRHTIYTDVPAQTRTLTYLKERTEAAVGPAVESERNDIVETIRKGISRRVQVSSVVEQSPWFYLVDFSVVDIKDGKEISRSLWRAGLRVDYLARTVPKKDLLDEDATNPFGFVVTTYVPEPLNNSGR